MDGWIKLHRSCLDHWLYPKNIELTRREAWETILLTVNYEASKVEIRGQLYECMAGQSLLSLESWAKKFCWSIQRVRTFFNLLEKDNMIETEGLQFSTRLTVCNWAAYQDIATDKQQANNKQITDKQQANNRQITTIEEREERKEREEEDIGAKSKRFFAPTIEELKAYCTERGNLIDPNRFFDFYESKNWMVGINKMKDWKAAVRTWEKNESANIFQKSTSNTLRFAQNNAQIPTFRNETIKEYTAKI